MVKGDIILTPFPFTDLAGSKLRPAVMLIETAKDFVVCFITLQVQWQELTDIYLLPAISNGLKWPSLIRTSKIATIQKSLTVGKMGRLDGSQLLELDKNLKKLFQLS
jgi:mRNA interferase MazF